MDNDNYLTLPPISLVEGEIVLPGSKSISNRVLLLASVAQGTTTLKNLLESDDTHYMLSNLKKLGIEIKIFTSENNIKQYQIIGNYKAFCVPYITTLFVGNAGTVIRPLSAMLSLKPKNEVILTGEVRMKERPIGDLVKALKQGGAKISFLDEDNYPPIYIKGGFTGGDIDISSNISSQFISSLLMMAPLAKKDTNLYFNNNMIVSKPYIDMTIKIIKQFGGKIYWDTDNHIFIPGKQVYHSPREYIIEGDATSASYFLAAGAVKGGKITVHGIGSDSIQGDFKIVNLLEKMGAKLTCKPNSVTINKRADRLLSLNEDLHDFPDIAITLAVLSVFAEGKTTLKNIYNLRIKETDRLFAISHELKKVGCDLEEGRDFIIIKPPKKIKSACINTYNDHRIAMSFSLLALSDNYITLYNPKCVNKTFPNFFKEFKKLCKLYI